MPSRKELREELSNITHESFSSSIPLAKTSYKESEAIRIKLQALISFHNLPQVDEILAKLNASETNISADTYRAYLRSIYMDITYHNIGTYDLVVGINRRIGERSSIGRNIAIHILYEEASEWIHTSQKH